MDYRVWLFLAIGIIVGIIICLLVRYFSHAIGVLIVDQTNPEKDLWQISILEDLDRLAKSNKKHVYLKIIRVKENAPK